MSKFKLPGHSFPGIKGFKSTSKKDGRAASSAFQMRSPFREEIKRSSLTGDEFDKIAGDNDDDDVTTLDAGIDESQTLVDDTEKVDKEEVKLDGGDNLDWIKNYDDDDETTTVDPNLASAQKEGQGGIEYMGEQLRKLHGRLNTPEAKEEKLKKKEARKAAKEEKKRKRDLKKNQEKNKSSSASEKMTARINKYTDEAKEFYGKLPWEEGYTEDEDAHYTKQALANK